MSVQAGTIINTVRDLIPDATYDAGGTPQPSVDGGIFRASTLFRFLNDAVKALAEQVGWVVTDWTAFAVTSGQPWYALDSSFHEIEDCFQNNFRCFLMPEGLTIWPQTQPSGQSFFYALHRTTDHLEIELYPIVTTTDPVTTFIAQGPPLNPVNTEMVVADTTGFLPYGYLLIESEIVSYQGLSGNRVLTMARGQCGTTAASHADGVSVTHLSAKVKGERMPAEITSATSIVELPTGFHYALQEYMLSKCNYAQNDVQAGKQHMAEFRQECKRISDDPRWRGDSQGTQVAPYGTPVRGGLIWGNVILP